MPETTVIATFCSSIPPMVVNPMGRSLSLDSSISNGRKASVAANSFPPCKHSWRCAFGGLGKCTIICQNTQFLETKFTMLYFLCFAWWITEVVPACVLSVVGNSTPTRVAIAVRTSSRGRARPPEKRSPTPNEGPQALCRGGWIQELV